MANPEPESVKFRSGRPKTGTVFPEQKIGESRVANRTVGSMSFPLDIGAHQFIMNFVKYSINNRGSSDSIVQTIALPLPGQGITDKAGMKYNEGELGLGGGAALAAGAGVTKAIENLQEGESVRAPDLASLTKTYLEGAGATLRNTVLKALEGSDAAAGQFFGNVVNPHVVLLFENVNLKQFQFQWKLSPRSEEESTRLKNIIYKLQQLTHPEQASRANNSNFFLNYPHQVDLYYAGVNENLHYFKRCAVTSLEVNYQPEQQNLLFAKTGAPSVIDLSMGFQETEIWTAEDYKELQDRI